MNRKALFAGALIVGAILLVGAAIGVPSVFGSSEDRPTISAEDAKAQRWQALGDYYTRHSASDLATSSAEDARAYRWQALGDYYTRHSASDLTTLSAEEVRALRWQALGEFYVLTGIDR